MYVYVYICNLYVTKFNKCKVNVKQIKSIFHIYKIPILTIIYNITFTLFNNCINFFVS